MVKYLTDLTQPRHSQSKRRSLKVQVAEALTTPNVDCHTKANIDFPYVRNSRGQRHKFEGLCRDFEIVGSIQGPVILAIEDLLGFM